MSKITDEELRDLQGIINELNKAQLSIGQLETQKANIISSINGIQTNLKEMQDSLETVYGKVSINIQDGTLSELDSEVVEIPLAK
jgi:archaellum component FlaC|tara:strand:+ start:61 stop:315 length:255 start_codon:yes stop_codon:yes gene_type:complete